MTQQKLVNGRLVDLSPVEMAEIEVNGWVAGPFHCPEDGSTDHIAGSQLGSWIVGRHEPFAMNVP